MIRIAVIGPESSGKSRLCNMFSERNDVHIVPEYSREFLTSLSRAYTIEDLSVIAKHQRLIIKEAENKSCAVLLADTEILTIKIWSLVKYGSCDKNIESLIRQQSFDHYLLCSPDLPWADDPLRESPNPEDRDRIFELFKSELKKLNWKFTVVSGDWPSRKEIASGVISSLAG